MKTPKKLTTQAAVVATTMLFFASPTLAAGHGKTHETLFPQDFKNTCGVSASTLETWFNGKSPTDGGWVNPANSVTFDDSSNCNFYQWGAQMFLWLTSPVSSGGPLVFSGPDFYDAVYTGGVDDNGFATFDLIRNGSSLPKGKSLRSIKPNGVEIDEIGQADGYVLVTPKNDTAYFGVHANDVYAAFGDMHQQANKGTPSEYFKESTEYPDAAKLATDFPTTATQLAFITDKTFPNDSGSFSDGIALTMELKTAWVDAGTLTNADHFIQLNAVVPEIIKREDNTTWQATNNFVSKTLALVGMHVVGSAKGHPEMIWASFEHIENAPDLPYYYHTATGTDPRLFTTSAKGKWTLFDGKKVPTEVIPTAQYALEKGTTTEGAIEALDGDKIKFVNVARLNPWGLPPSDKSAADDATDLLSLNNSVMSALAAAGDVRAYYYQIGSIWTDGTIPKNATDKTAGGTYLANTTMETFHQFPDGLKIPGSGKNAFQAQNCFACHGTSGAGLGTSHVFLDVIDIVNPPAAN